MGHEVVGSLNPGQALGAVVSDELTHIMGGDLPLSETELP
ncbi:signal recognition particle protein [Oligella ureolytica]